MDVDDALVAEVAAVPHPFQQGAPAQHPAGRGGQLAQQPELGQREVDLLTTAAHDAGADVEDERSTFGVENQAGLLNRGTSTGRHGDPRAAPQARRRAPISFTWNGFVT